MWVGVDSFTYASVSQTGGSQFTWEALAYATLKGRRQQGNPQVCFPPLLAGSVSIHMVQEAPWMPPLGSLSFPKLKVTSCFQLRNEVVYTCSQQPLITLTIVFF